MTDYKKGKIYYTMQQLKLAGYEPIVFGQTYDTGLIQVNNYLYWCSTGTYKHVYTNKTVKDRPLREFISMLTRQTLNHEE